MLLGQESPKQHKIAVLVTKSFKVIEFARACLLWKAQCGNESVSTPRSHDFRNWVRIMFIGCRSAFFGPNSIFWRQRRPPEGTVLILGDFQGKNDLRANQGDLRATLGRP